MFRKLLFVALCALPSVAHAEWFEASSPHFVVYANDNPDKIRKFTERLERFDKGLRTLFGTAPRQAMPASRVTVYYLDGVSEIQRLYGGTGVAGFYEGRASGSVAFVPETSSSGGMWDLDSQTILFHEYAHHFMYSNWTGAVFPQWFSEGFAEFAATAVFRSNGDVTFGNVPTYRGWNVLNSIGLPARKLLLPDPGKLDSKATDTLYSRGWLLTHYLLFDKERSGQLAQYLIALNSGKSIDDANKAFGDVSSLDGRLNAYARRTSFPTYTMTPDQVPIAQVTLRTLSPGEAAIMPARIRSTRGVDGKTAPDVLALARRLAAPFPNDAAAQNELAEAEFDAGNYAESEAAAERARAADPKSIHALLYKGMAQVELARKDKLADPAKWQAIRQSFLAANKIDTEDPEPLIQYYRSFAAAGQEPTLNAQAALVYAYALAPFDLELRLAAAEVLLAQDKGVAAEVALEPVAFSPHGGEARERAAKVVAAIRDKGTAAALELLRAENKQDAKGKKEDGKG